MNCRMAPGACTPSSAWEPLGLGRAGLPGCRPAWLPCGLAACLVRHKCALPLAPPLQCPPSYIPLPCGALLTTSYCLPARLPARLPACLPACACRYFGVDNVRQAVRRINKMAQRELQVCLVLCCAVLCYGVVGQRSVCAHAKPSLLHTNYIALAPRLPRYAGPVQPMLRCAVCCAVLW